MTSRRTNRTTSRVFVVADREPDGHGKEVVNHQARKNHYRHQTRLLVVRQQDGLPCREEADAALLSTHLNALLVGRSVVERSHRDVRDGVALELGALRLHGEDEDAVVAAARRREHLAVVGDAVQRRCDAE